MTKKLNFFHYSTDNVCNGPEVELSGTYESAGSTQTQSSVLSSRPSCVVKPRPPLKKLTIPIKALPASLSPIGSKTFLSKHPYSASSSRYEFDCKDFRLLEGCLLV